MSNIKNKELRNYKQIIDEKEKKMNDVIDNLGKNRISHINEDYKNFKVKNSILQIFSNFFINKRTILLLTSLFIAYILNKFFHSHFKNSLNYISKIAVIKRISEFIKGLLILLVNS